MLKGSNALSEKRTSLPIRGSLTMNSAESIKSDLEILTDPKKLLFYLSFSRLTQAGTVKVTFL